MSGFDQRRAEFVAYCLAARGTRVELVQGRRERDVILLATLNHDVEIEGRPRYTLDLGGKSADGDEGDSMPAQHPEEFDWIKPSGRRHASPWVEGSRALPRPPPASSPRTPRAAPASWRRARQQGRDRCPPRRRRRSRTYR